MRNYKINDEREVLVLSKSKSEAELQQHKAQALGKLSAYLDQLITSDDPKQMGKADKLSYWLKDWCTFLDFESQFSPMSLRRYERGEIIKVHLGFNIGSEEGGLHYAVVLDKYNPKSSPVVTIIPLTSVKPKTDLNHLKSGNVFLGNELYTNLSSKISTTQKRINEEVSLLAQIIKRMSDDSSSEENQAAIERLDKLIEECNLLDRMRDEIFRMRTGSIALINQITTISKIRIYDPKTDHDILSNIKLSNEKLDLIDAEMRKKFISK